jgi:protein-tyrosine-phosphatase
MSRRKNIHVVPHGDEWAVKSEGTEKPLKVTKTKKEAVEIAREKAKKRSSELIIHKKDGKISQKESYGNDPCPPKDKEH